MASLYESLTWYELPLLGHAAAQVTLRYAEVGTSGPRVLLVAGTHGDEGPWSALAIKELLQHDQTSLKGRLRVIFTANPLAAESDARNSPLDSPNCVDLDGCFPGNPRGSHTERIAAHLAPLVADSDIVLDLHGGGSWNVNAFSKRFEGSEDLVTDMGAPFFRDAPNKPGGLTTYAKAQGAKVINVEIGGRSGEEVAWCRHIVQGLERILYNHDVLKLDTPPTPPEPGVEVGPTEAVRSSTAGIFVPTVRENGVGTMVSGGTELGKILDLHTLEELEVFTAPYDPTALMLLRPHIAVVEGGAIIYVVAQPLSA